MRTVLAILALLLATPAAAQKSADTLRITWRDAVPNLDPYFNQLRTGLIVAFHVWDTLVYRDPDTLLIKPALASSWRLVDDTTIDFSIRPGVKFQNGDTLSAEDVVYTVWVATHDKVAVPSNYAYIAGAEALDPMTVRIKLARVFPAALEYIATTLPIYPKAYRERVGSEAFARVPIGTGPYRVTQVEDDRVRLDRFDGYYAESPKGHPAIAHIAIHQVLDAASELSDLLSGQADWIWDFAPDKFDIVAQVPTLVALRAETMRVAYLSMDAAGRTDPSGPLTNEHVRQAIAHAIDRGTIARTVMGGGSRVLDAPCFPTQIGCEQAFAVKYAYNPALARQMLAEAGFAGGFHIELVSYVLPALADAVRENLKAVGIDAQVTQLTTGEAARRSIEGKNPLYMGSWGSYSINDVSAFLPFFFAGGGDDYTRDPEITKKVLEGGATIDPDQRRQFYADAIRAITTHADWLPLFSYVKTYGFSRQLAFRPPTDEIPRFYAASWR